VDSLGTSHIAPLQRFWICLCWLFIRDYAIAAWGRIILRLLPATGFLNKNKSCRILTVNSFFVARYNLERGTEALRADSLLVLAVTPRGLSGNHPASDE